MIFLCNGCDKKKDFACLKMIIANHELKKLTRLCGDCRRGNIFSPDIFWDGKPEENLADDPITGKPRVFISKGQKSAYLKERGLQEAGDRVHGAPVSFVGKSPKVDSHHEVMMALKKVKEMGKDVRHQEYLRVVKEAQVAQQNSRR